MIIGWKKKTAVASVFLLLFISLRRMKIVLRIGGQDIYPDASFPKYIIRTIKVFFRLKDENLPMLQYLTSAVIKFIYMFLDFTNQNDRFILV